MRKSALTGGDDTTAVVWELGSEGRQVGSPLSGHRGPVTAVALADLFEGPMAATGGKDAEVRLWSVTKGSLAKRFVGSHTGAVNALHFFRSRDVLLLASGSADGTVRLWDVRRCRAIGPVLAGHHGDVDLLETCQIGDHVVLLAATRWGHASAWNVATGDMLPVVQPSLDRWTTFAVGGIDGRAAALLVDSANSVQLWDLVEGQPLGRRLQGHTAAVKRAALGERHVRPVAVTVDNDGQVLTWDLREGRQLGQALVAQPYGTRGLAIGPSGDGVAVMASGDNYDSQTRLWSLEDFQQLGDALTGASADSVSLALAKAGGRDVVVTTSEVSVLALDAGSGQLAGPLLNGHISNVMSVDTAELDGPLAVSFGWDKAVRVWDLRTHRQRFHWAHTEHGSDIRVLRRHGRPVVTVAAASSLHVWELENRSVLAELTGHTGQIVALDGAEIDGTPVVLSGSADGTARMWDLDVLRPLGPPIQASDVSLTEVALGTGDDGLVVYTGDSDGVVRSWNPATGDEIDIPFPRFDLAVTALTCGTLHGRRMVAMSADSGILRLWCRDTERLVLQIRLTTTIQDLVLTGDGEVYAATTMGVVALHVDEDLVRRSPYA